MVVKSKSLQEEATLCVGDLTSSKKICTGSEDTCITEVNSSNDSTGDASDKSNVTSLCEDISVRAGIRLYYQAVDQNRRQEAIRREAAQEKDRRETNSCIPFKRSSIPRKQNPSLLKYRSQKQQPVPESEIPKVNLGGLKAAPVPKVCNRLYDDAVDRIRRQEAIRKEVAEDKGPGLDLATKSRIGHKLRQFVGKKNQELLKDRVYKPRAKEQPNLKKKSIAQLKSAPVPNVCSRLYDASNTQQLAGKTRRQSIEYAQAMAKVVPETKVIPVSRAGDMYTRSMQQLAGKTWRQSIEYAQEMAKVVPESKVIPVSRAGDMYTRSMQQLAGKTWRQSIEYAQEMAKVVPESKVIPVSRAGDMYTRSMQRMFAKQMRIAALAGE